MLKYQGLGFRGCLKSKWHQLNEEEDSLSLAHQIMHSTNTLEHALIFLECMLNEHVFKHLVSLGKKFNFH